MQSKPFTKRGYTTPEAARYIGRSISWLRKKRLRGPDDPGDPGPRYLKPDGGSAIYLLEDLDRWLNSLVSPRPPEGGEHRRAHESLTDGAGSER
jgi:hypothetical protein